MKVHTAMEVRIVIGVRIALHSDDSARDGDSDIVAGVSSLPSVWSARARRHKHRTSPHASMLIMFRPFQ